jgi:hypothetical protein
MPSIDVELSADEILAAGGDPHIPVHCTYPDAWAEVDEHTGLLRVCRGDHIVTEYPAGRFETWQVIEGEPETPAGP